MRCRQAQRYISEHVDRTLSAGREASLRRHLEGCAGCRAFLEDMRAIAGQAKSLEKLVPPDRVWLKIRAGLREERSAAAARAAGSRKRLALSFASPRFRFALASSLAMLVAVAGLFYFQPWRKSLPLESVAVERQTLEKLNEAEWHYQQAIKALGEAVAAQQGRLDPQMAQVFRSNLEIVDSSIEACRQAVRRDPRDLKAQNALMMSYKDKVKILTEWISLQSQFEPETTSGIIL